MDLTRFMSLDLVYAVIAVVASFIVVKIKTASNEDDIKDLKNEIKLIKDVMIPAAKKETVERFDKDLTQMKESLEKRDLAVWNKLDAIQISINQIMQTLGRLEGRIDISHENQ